MRLQSFFINGLCALRMPCLALLLAILAAAGPASAADSAAGGGPVAAAFLPLAPGAVEPAGWLRDWALAARDGITGHLDEYHPTFHDAWKNLRPDRRTAWQTNEGSLEQCSYWLDGLVRLGYMLHDDHLVRKATDRLNLVVEGVNRGGNSFLYWRTKPLNDFLGWAHSHMGRALVAWYEASGDKRILDALVKVYAQYPLPMGRLRFDAGDTWIASGLCNLDAMIETYRLSGDRRVLEHVRAAMEAAEVRTALHEWADGQFLPGHAVITHEHVRLPALFYLAGGQRQCLDASLRAFQWLDQNHLLPYGVTSGEEFVSGIGAFRCTETCDVVAMIWSNVWLLRITGERSFGDSVERAFFNAGPAPVSRDFQTMTYYQSPNRIQAGSLPADQAESPGVGCHLFTQLGYPPVLCCVGAVNRLVPNYVTHMWMATADHGLAAALYGPCKVSAIVAAGTPLKLTCQTAYPFEETISVAVDPERPASFPLYFRIPGWCAKPRIAVNGVRLETAADAKGFVRIERQWSKGDAIALEFPMAVKVSRGFETEYPPLAKDYFSFKPPAAFAKRRLPYESVLYGPLLFALAIPDKDPNTPVSDARWQYALDNEAGRGGADITVNRGPMPAKWDWPLAASLTLEVPARAFDWRPTDDQALPPAPVEAGKAETIRLVPYGCTKFRISMFPVTPRAWAGQPGVSGK
jgi:hypothetical protein